MFRFTICGVLWLPVAAAACALLLFDNGRMATGQDAQPLPVTMGRVPEIQLERRLPLTEVQIRRIRKLIAELATFEHPDFGLSSTLSGDAFAPIAGQSHATTVLLADHQLAPSETLKSIVAFGPRAVPFLLESLDDQTPTKMVVKHEFVGGGMWHADELPMNPVNPAEEAVYKAQVAKRGEKVEALDKFVESYRIKIGDVCFVAIGQIVGRSYQAVRYQPTANIVLNCPSHTPSLCKEVRAIWHSNDARDKLFQSLLADYATEGIFNGRSLDGWDVGSTLQIGAALRMLYYFPEESAELIAERLDRLDVGKDKGISGHMQRCVCNGVRADLFIEALAWSKQPAVKSALLRVFERAEDGQCLLAAMPAVDDRETICQRLEAGVRALPADESGPYGDGYHLLLALVQRTPQAAKSVCQQYVQELRINRCRSLCSVLRDAKVPWDAELLVPMLSDRRTFGWTYAMVPGQNEPRALIRVCDEAALTLAQNHPELKFLQAGSQEELDRQIDEMRKALSLSKR